MAASTPDLPKNIGWIGLGLMGLPMSINLLKKTSPETKLYVYDISKESINKLVEQGNGRVEACGSSKEVADKSVCHTSNSTYMTSLLLLNAC